MTDAAIRPNDGPIAGSQSVSAQALQAVRRDVFDQAALLKVVDDRVGRLTEAIESLDDRGRTEIGGIKDALGDLQGSFGGLADRQTADAISRDRGLAALQSAFDGLGERQAADATSRDGSLAALQKSLDGLSKRQAADAASLTVRLDALQDVLTRVAAFEMIRAELQDALDEIAALKSTRKADLARIHSLAHDRDALENELQANAARHRQESATYRTTRAAPALPPVVAPEPPPPPPPVHVEPEPPAAATPAPVAINTLRRPTGATPMPAFTRKGPLDAAQAQILLDQARAAMRARDWAAGIAAYSAFLSYQPAKPGPWKQFGHALKESGDLGAAEQAYFRALALDASDVDTAIHLGHVLKNQDLRDQAAEVFAAALQMDPKSEAARDGLDSMGYPWPDLQRTSRVETPRLSFLKRYEAKKALAKAKRAARARDWMSAAELYGRLLETSPANTRLLIQRGHAFKEMGQLERAESLYREALGFEPLNSDAQLHIGHIRKLQGDAEGARASYLHAVRFNPDNQDALDEL